MNRKHNKRNYINKKLFNSALFNNLKIGQNVGTLGYLCKFKVGTERVKCFFFNEGSGRWGNGNFSKGKLMKIQ